MNKLAKFFRSLGGVCMLLQLVVCFLPVLVIVQENYLDEKYSQVRFLKEAFQQLTAGNVNQQVLLIGGVILLPAVLSLIMGIVGIVGNKRQIVSCVTAILILGLNIAFCYLLPKLQPEPLNSAQIYQKGYGYWCLLGVSGIAAICGIAGIIATPRKKKATEQTIPFLREEKSAPVYNTQATQSQPAPATKPQPVQSQPAAATKPQSVQTQPAAALHSQAQPDDVTVALDDIIEPPHSQSPRGVLVGLTGIYRGAEIPFRPGETLKLGRDMSNDLIFEGETKVSRYHCAITWFPETQKFKIIDQSANGCFVNGSEDCLPQNMEIELAPGTILAIGDQKNIFRLE